MLQIRAVVRGTSAWDLIQDGKLDLNEGLFRTAMDTGMEALLTSMMLQAVNTKVSTPMQ